MKFIWKLLFVHCIELKNIIYPFLWQDSLLLNSWDRRARSKIIIFLCLPWLYFSLFCTFYSILTSLFSNSSLCTVPTFKFYTHMVSIRWQMQLSDNLPLMQNVFRIRRKPLKFCFHKFPQSYVSPTAIKLDRTVMTEREKQFLETIILAILTHLDGCCNLHYLCVSRGLLNLLTNFASRLNGKWNCIDQLGIFLPRLPET